MQPRPVSDAGPVQPLDRPSAPATEHASHATPSVVPMARAAQRARSGPATRFEEGAAPANDGSSAPVLDEQAFVRELGRETRRAERTTAPLSLQVFRSVVAERESPVASESEARSRDLLGLLQQHCRRTDVLGRLDDGGVAILFPDTSEPGARRFLEKVEKALGQAGHPGVSVATAAYPNCLFDQLSRGSAQVADAALAHVVTASEPPAPAYRGKRSFDVAVSAALLLLLSPLMLLAALAIRLTSPGPVIFRQKRLGMGGRAFTFYKFRSMTADGDDSIHRAFVTGLIRGQEPVQPVPGGGAVYKLHRDPRVTAVGRVIRKTSIDELPQLFNVLRGDMSLVGPRPPLPYEAEHYSAWHLRRIAVMKPGITGMWQVGGRSRVPFDEMVRMDLRYIRQCSFWLDLKILARTVAVVLRCEGAG